MEEDAPINGKLDLRLRYKLIHTYLSRTIFFLRRLWTRWRFLRFPWRSWWSWRRCEIVPKHCVERRLERVWLIVCCWRGSWEGLLLRRCGCCGRKWLLWLWLCGCSDLWSRSWAWWCCLQTNLSHLKLFNFSLYCYCYCYVFKVDFCIVKPDILRAYKLKMTLIFFHLMYCIITFLLKGERYSKIQPVERAAQAVSQSHLSLRV